MKTIQFELQDDYIELIKLLKVTGLCDTGGMAKWAVESGSVMVDGELEQRKRCKLRKGQQIEFQGYTIDVF